MRWLIAIFFAATLICGAGAVLADVQGSQCSGDGCMGVGTGFLVALGIVAGWLLLTICLTALFVVAVIGHTRAKR